jgi:hypothetical protein
VRRDVWVDPSLTPVRLVRPRRVEEFEEFEEFEESEESLAMSLD